MSTFGPRSQTTRPVAPDVEKHNDAVRFSQINPEAAIAKAEQLPEGDKRAATMLEVARGMAGHNPERAAELIAEAERGAMPPSEEMQLSLISARASVAAAQDKKDELQELLQRGFEWANRVMLDQQRTGGVHSVAGLGQLVQIGAQNNPDSTIAFVQNISPSDLKAHLLFEAAAALILPARRPIGSRQQQKSEKPDQ
jgi:hypothetical protein